MDHLLHNYVDRVQKSIRALANSERPDGFISQGITCGPKIDHDSIVALGNIQTDMSDVVQADQPAVYSVDPDTYQLPVVRLEPKSEPDPLEPGLSESGPLDRAFGQQLEDAVYPFHLSIVPSLESEQGLSDLGPSDPPASGGSEPEPSEPGLAPPGLSLMAALAIKPAAQTPAPAAGGNLSFKAQSVKADNALLKQARAEAKKRDCVDACQLFVEEMEIRLAAEIQGGGDRPWKDYVQLSRQWGCPLPEIAGLNLYLREMSSHRRRKAVSRKAAAAALVAAAPALAPVVVAEGVRPKTGEDNGGAGGQKRRRAGTAKEAGSGMGPRDVAGQKRRRAGSGSGAAGEVECRGGGGGSVKPSTGGDGGGESGGDDLDGSGGCGGGGDWDGSVGGEGRGGDLDGSGGGEGGGDKYVEWATMMSPVGSDFPRGGDDVEDLLWLN